MELNLGDFLLREWPGILVFIISALGVWLTIKQTVWCWPVSLIAVIVSIVILYDARLYGDMALQIFYFFAGIYGWVYWEKNKDQVFKVTSINRNLVPVLIGITLLQAVAYYYLLVYFKGDRPLLDGTLTACSLTITYMMTKKWIENWLLWVFIDAAYVLLFCLKEMWFFAATNLLMAIIAYFGWLKWRRELSIK